jgi:uncharacterized protein
MMATTIQIDLSLLQSGAKRITVQEHITLPDVGVYRFLNGADIQLNIENLGGAVDAYGNATLVYTSSCDRCLEDYSAPLVVNIDEHLAMSSSSDPLSDNNVIQEGKMDVGDLARQLVSAELPYVSLCREDCAGLCTSCGMNQNEGTCSCEAVTKGDHG